MNQTASPITRLDSLYDQYAAAYYGAILRQLHSPKLATEVLVEAFKNISIQIENFDERSSSLFAWGFRFVRKEISRKKTELVLQEIFACRNPESYLKQRLKVESAG
jgi:DNA-directed RNA polymerase specialized sigma24 family protein